MKEKKIKKRLIIGSIVGIILLLGGIYLYKTYALYEEKKEFNILKGKVGDFSTSKDVTLASVIDGNPSDKIPKKNEGYIFESVSCDNKAEAIWDVDKWGIFVSNLTTSRTTCTINFNGVFKDLVHLINSSATNMEELLKNNEDIEKIIQNKEAMELIANNQSLANLITGNENYSVEIAKKFLSSTVISEEAKYNAGLPCYLFLNEKYSSFLGDFTNKMEKGVEASSYDDYGNGRINLSHRNTIYTKISNSPLNLEHYNTLEMYYHHYTNNTSLKGMTMLGVVPSKEDEWFDTNKWTVSNVEVFENTEKNTTLTADISNINDNQHLKLWFKHNGEVEAYTIYNQIYTIALY